jgi:hypothetical protein
MTDKYWQMTGVFNTRRATLQQRNSRAGDGDRTRISNFEVRMSLALGWFEILITFGFRLFVKGQVVSWA